MIKYLIKLKESNLRIRVFLESNKILKKSAEFGTDT